MPYFLIPVVILGALVLLLGVLIFLGRFRKGRYLRPLITTLTKVPLIRRMFQRLSTAALEKQNPELVSVMRKLERAGASRDPAKAQQVIHGLNPAERRAYNDYMELAREQGEEPVAPNRQIRRLQQRQYGQPRAGGGGGGGGNRKRKRK